MDLPQGRESGVIVAHIVYMAHTDLYYYVKSKVIVFICAAHLELDNMLF